MNTEKDTWKLGDHEFTSRFILGSGKYSLDLIQAAVENAGAQIVTMALRRAKEGGLANILDYIPEGITILPNTSGARNADGRSVYFNGFALIECCAYIPLAVYVLDAYHIFT